MKPGPKPKPTAVHELEGGRKKTHRPAPKNEPKIQRPDRPPPAPKFLNKDGKKEWRKMARLLHESRVLTKADLTALAGYCKHYQNWREAIGKVEAFGMVIKAQSGFPVMSPYIGIENTQSKLMLKYMAELGITPSSRTRVAAAPKDDEVDPLKEFFEAGDFPRRVK